MPAFDAEAVKAQYKAKLAADIARKRTEIERADLEQVELAKASRKRLHSGSPGGHRDYVAKPQSSVQVETSTENYQPSARDKDLDRSESLFVTDSPGDSAAAQGSTSVATSTGAQQKKILISTNAFQDERRQRRASKPDRSRAQPKTPTESSNSFSRSMATALTTVSPSNPVSEVDWPNIAWIAHAYRQTQNSGTMQAEIVRIRTLIKNYERGRQIFTHAEGQESLNQIRNELHVLEYKNVEQVAVAKSRILDRSVGIPSLFAGQTFTYPPDIRADAKELAYKWRRMDFDPDIAKGITNFGKRNAALHKDYAHRMKADFFGAGDLVNGQWFPSQLAAVRDGAHGTPQGGIYGPGDHKEACSIILSHSDYNDVDNGDQLEYCGTDRAYGADSDTKATERMKASSRSTRPVRVLRSYNLPKTNPFRPECGLRYDGLYQVLRYEIVDQAKGTHKFFLRRLDNQDPIRYQGLGKRPTTQEIEEWNRYKEALKLMAGNG